MILNRLCRYFWHVCAIILMIVIFAFSSHSGTQSSEVSSGITSLLFAEHNRDYISFLSAGGISPNASAELFLRKFAHFTEYAFLGFCVANAVCRHTDDTESMTLFSLLIPFIYSVSDEIHQYFVPQRSCSIADIMIDTSGIIAGFFTAMLLRKTKVLLKYKK